MVTIKDLAKIANVSPTTISNVLNGRTNKMSAATLEKVQQAIDQTGYVSNMGGRLLARHGSRIIGVIMTYARREVTNATEYPFYSEIIRAIEEEIRANNYYMMLYTSGSIEESLNLSKAWDIEGLIVLGNTPEEAERFNRESSVPVMFIDTYSDKVPNVGIHDEQAMEEMVNYLVSLGHKKIAFVSDSDVLVGVDAARYNGYKKGLAANKINMDKDDGIIHIDFRENIRKAMYKEFSKEKFMGYSALCFTSDYYAVEALSFFSQQGFKIPDDISITGFDNNILAKYSIPRLTTVNQNVSKKGKTAVQELICLIKNRENSMAEPCIVLATDLVIGQSAKYILH